MKPTNSHSRWEHLIATGTCLFLPLAVLPTDIEFNTVASWYGPGFDGKKTASGEVYDQNKMTAASKELPFGTKLAVKNLRNGRSCVVVINDRGPYVRGRGIDLSREAARRIGMDGTAPVYCCSATPTKPAITIPATIPAVTKPAINNPIQSVDVASLAPVVEPTLNSDLSPANTAAPSRAVPHHRGILRMTKRAHTFQYVAYLGAKRVQLDGTGSASKFVRNYRA
jgi:rare lipoprotein A (peptidoglycan hydrolase)